MRKIIQYISYFLMFIRIKKAGRISVSYDYDGVDYTKPINSKTYPVIDRFEYWYYIEYNESRIRYTVNGKQHLIFLPSRCFFLKVFWEIMKHPRPKNLSKTSELITNCILKITGELIDKNLYIASGYY